MSSSDPSSSSSSAPDVDPEVIDVDPVGASDPGSEDPTSEDAPSDDAPSDDSADKGFGFEDLFDGEVFKRLKIDVDPDRVDESVDRLTREVRKAVVRGRYTKVRIQYKGKPLMRDIPLG